jgi:hypothetical protein
LRFGKHLALLIQFITHLMHVLPHELQFVEGVG